MKIDMDKSITQTEFGRLIGVSQQAVSDMISRGVIDRGESAATWLLKCFANQREVSAGRQGDGELDLVEERARLASEQADKVAMQNAVTRQELAPVHTIEDVLTKAGAKVSGILEAIPGAIRRRVPALKAPEMDLIEREISKARNIAASVSLSDIGALAFAVGTKEGALTEEE